VRPARVLRRRQRRHGPRAQRGGLGGPRAAAAALLRVAADARGRRGRGARAGEGDYRRLRGLRRRRRQCRRMRLRHEGLRAPARRRPAVGRARRRPSPPACATSPSCSRSTSRRLPAGRCRCAWPIHDACHLAHAQGVRTQPARSPARDPWARAARAGRLGDLLRLGRYLQPRTAPRRRRSSARARPPT
jgi:hypothetical protein